MATTSCAGKYNVLNLADGLEVIFADKTLEAAVRKELKKSKGQLTRGDLKKLEGLVAQGEGIRSLSGLEHATSLTGLSLEDNQISDLSPLASLTNLTMLYRSFNPLNQESIDTHVPDLRSRGVRFY